MAAVVGEDAADCGPPLDLGDDLIVGHRGILPVIRLERDGDDEEQDDQEHVERDEGDDDVVVGHAALRCQPSATMHDSS